MRSAACVKKSLWLCRVARRRSLFCTWPAVSDHFNSTSRRTNCRRVLSRNRLIEYLRYSSSCSGSLEGEGEHKGREGEEKRG